MFCPVCKFEYRPGFTRCSDCDVDLVASLPSTAAAAPSDVAVAWRGSDPVGFSAALAALRDAEIPNYQIGDHDQLVWGLAIPRPQYSIWVRRSDLERALRSVSGITERSPLAFGSTPEWALNEDQTASDGTADRREVPDDIVPDFNVQDASLEVWSGEEGEVAETLQACLRGIGIGCVVDESGGKKHIRVLPASGDRAREIVREVIEGTPPE